MGTSFNIKINESDKIDKIKQIEYSIDSILVSLNQQMSTWIEDSEISFFNQSQSTSPFKISDEFYHVLDRGKLINKGWGAKHGSPGIILDIEAQEVEGFVFTSDNLSKNIGFLDKFEGAEYKRVITEVRLEDNAIINSYIYQLQIEDKAY